ncbi:MAG TPA: helix-turn-helix domain-containing protein [Actinomycetota bacterium]|nr:helix-turn-helix domain-containing protein [Actinomycetota bacterium]
MARPAVLAHPIRLRVVLALVGDRELTTAEIAAEMPDVPTATLYRHIAALSKAGVLDVVSERRVRGAVERTFALHQGAALVDSAAAAEMTTEEKSAAFGVFAASLIAAYDGYLTRKDSETKTSPLFNATEEWKVLHNAPQLQAGYRALAMYLDEEDIVALAAGVRDALVPYLTPAEGKERVLFSTVFIPS